MFDVWCGMELQDGGHLGFPVKVKYFFVHLEDHMYQIACTSDNFEKSVK